MQPPGSASAAHHLGGCTSVLSDFSEEASAQWNETIFADLWYCWLWFHFLPCWYRASVHFQTCQLLTLSHWFHNLWCADCGWVSGKIIAFYTRAFCPTFYIHLICTWHMVFILSLVFTLPCSTAVWIDYLNACTFWWLFLCFVFACLHLNLIHFASLLLQSDPLFHSRYSFD